MATSSKHSRVTEPSTESLESSLPKRLADVDDISISSKVSIFMVPKILRRHNHLAYEPNAFSIGPFHYEKKDLQPTQSIKLKYLHGLLRRSSDPEKLLSQLIKAVREIQKGARECYAGDTHTISDQEFVQILLVDGCFIIELFRKDALEVMKEPDDPLFNMSYLLENLKHDLILLENQIPWLVLECLFDLTMVPEGRSLIELALDFYGDLFSSHKPHINRPLFANREIKHILDLLRLSLVLPLDRYQGSGWQFLFPTAKKAKDSGIKFREVASDSVLDVRFNNGVLEIPQLLVHETTETIFRNLISLEQCLPNCSPIVTSYAILMDSLVGTRADVEILCDNEILDNWLKPEDTARFFSSLYNDANVRTFYYQDICHQVNTYCRRWWPKWRCFYLHNFNTPWAIVSQVVGVVLFIFGYLQTYFTIATYLHETKQGSAPPPS